jgi:hypothetical protein
MELAHTTLDAIKLDKTAPLALLQINGGATATTSAAVTLTLTATDTASGISQMRISNDATWNQAAWEPFLANKNWQLSNGDGAKTVYCQIQNNAGFTTTISASITLTTQNATPPPRPQTPLHPHKHRHQQTHPTQPQQYPNTTSK